MLKKILFSVIVTITAIACSKSDVVFHLEENIINAPFHGGVYEIKFTSPTPIHLSERSTHPDNPGVLSPETIDIYEDGAKKGISLEASQNNNVITISVTPNPYKLTGQKYIDIIDDQENNLATITVNQEANPNGRLPGLNDYGRTLFTRMVLGISSGLGSLDKLERMYAHNSSEGDIIVPLNAHDERVSSIWRALYQRIRMINSFRQIDSSQLDIYGPLIDFYAALCYKHMSDLWGDLSYPMDMSYYSEAIQNNDFSRTNRSAILQNLTTRLKATLNVTDDKQQYGCELTTDELFFIPQNFVRILLGYVLMEQGNYNDANTYLHEIWSSKYYSLIEYAPGDLNYDGGRNQYLWGISKDDNTKSSIDKTGHVVIFSYGEVLLSLAECKYKIGDDSGALSIINEVGMAKGWEEEKKDAAQIIPYILELRKQEMYPYHFAFLKRNGLAQQELGITNDDWLLLPIPSSEVESGYNISQNPGY